MIFFDRKFLGLRWNVLIPGGYFWGTQEKYNSFSSRTPITEKGKELECRRGGRGKGYEDRFAVFNLTALRAVEGTAVSTGNPGFFRDFFIEKFIRRAGRG